MEFVNINENCLSIVFDERINPEINAQVIQMKSTIQNSDIVGINELVISYNTLVIYFDDTKTNHTALTEAVQKLELISDDKYPATTYIIPVCYDAPFNLDLEEMATRHNKSTDEIIQIHTSKPYLIYMLGFMPGFPFLGGLDESIATPRKSSPRKEIPAGSVGIANAQTGIYPLASPGGWNIIGRTPLRLFDPNRNPEVYYEAGDYIKFKRISKDEYDTIEQSVNNGTYVIETEVH
ncbi:5-oxoprolinase subunit PxpB [Macrococcus sp. EM39E]|uniref:5-oxoprolinase subunit PxpB n=1 Tax=Macrococcus animalis TaxID=3395467 RepID=UPI0039BEC83D